MFRLTALAKLAKPGPPLAPILGQQQIKVVDFLNDFNRATTHLIEGIPLGCRIKKLPGIGKFTLKVCPPSYTVLLFSVANSKRQIDPIDLYKVAYLRIKGEPFKAGLNPALFKTILGTMRSCRLHLK